MANILSHAWQYQDVDGSALSESKSMNRIQALSIPLEKAEKQVLTVQAELGIRQVHLTDQKSRLEIRHRESSKYADPNRRCGYERDRHRTTENHYYPGSLANVLVQNSFTILV